MCMSGWPRRTCQGGPRRLTGCLEACRVGVGHLITFDWAAWVPITFDQPWVDRVPVKLHQGLGNQVPVTFGFPSRQVSVASTAFC